MNPYETDFILSQYLLFHYGSVEEQMPFDLGTLNSVDFPQRCIFECIDIKKIPSDAVGLDLGCAVGRASFELAKYCKRVIGIDNSHAFIHAAKQIQQGKALEYLLKGEGTNCSKHIAKLSDMTYADRVEFRCHDALDLADNGEIYDVVLAANLLCRLKNPKLLLNLFSQLVKPNGQLIVVTPYSWLDRYTARSAWLSPETIYNALSQDFSLVRRFDMPFSLREHLRKYQWVVGDASIWLKK